MNYLVDVLYIFAFSLFIYGLSGLTGPKRQVQPRPAPDRTQDGGAR